jgi:hypothetical protein
MIRNSWNSVWSTNDGLHRRLETGSPADWTPKGGLRLIVRGCPTGIQTFGTQPRCRICAGGTVAFVQPFACGAGWALRGLHGPCVGNCCSPAVGFCPKATGVFVCAGQGRQRQGAIPGSLHTPDTRGLSSDLT